MGDFSYPDLVIPQGQQESNVLVLGSYAESITIWAPDTLTETITVHTAPSASDDYDPHQSGGLDIVIAAGKAITIRDIGSVAVLKLVANTGVGTGGRTFKVRGYERYY